MPQRPMLFDLDGTLVHSLPDIAASVNHVLGRFGLPGLPEERVRHMIGDGLVALLERALGPRFPAPEQALEAYREHHWDQCTRLVEPFPGVAEALGRWQSAGHPLAIVTNKPERFARRVVEHMGWTDLFPVVIGGDTTPTKKPHPQPVQEGLRRLGITDGNGSQALMVGDSLGDVRAGRAAGARTAAVLYGYGFEADLRSSGADEYWEVFGG